MESTACACGRRFYSNENRCPECGRPPVHVVQNKPTCEHVWTRTGSDTLFCFRCKTSLNEPEDK